MANNFESAELAMAIAAAQQANLMEGFPVNQLGQWQQKAVEVLSLQADREVMWVFDFEGNTGKTQLSRYLVNIMGYQHIFPGWGRQTHKYINGNAEGYCVDLIRSNESNYSKTIQLIMGVKEGIIRPNKYTGRDVFLRSKKLIIFANFMPNLSLLPLDWWVMFHTRMGQVCLNCVPDYERGYSCTISRTMVTTASAHHFGARFSQPISDATLCDQLLQSKTTLELVMSCNNLEFFFHFCRRGTKRVSLLMAVYLKRKWGQVIGKKN